MSFSSEVKKELLDVTDLKEEEKKALLYGLLQGNSEIIISRLGYKIVFKTTLLNVLKFIIPELRKYYDINVGMSFKDELNLEKRRFYYLEIIDKAENIIQDFKLIPTIHLSRSDEIIKTDNLKQAFLRGLFIAKGSINDPRKNCYHFEISSSKDNVIELAYKIFKKREIMPKIIERKNQSVLYIKKSEDISKALALIGANSGVFYFEDQRILRDVSNMANRMTNCDIANEVRCTNACDKQLKAIEYLRNNDLFDKMSIRLQTAAQLREEYPDSSLEELALYSSNIFGKSLSKSGVSHCLKDLMQYYESVKR